MRLVSRNQKYNLVILPIEGNYAIPDYKGRQKFLLRVYDVKRRVFIRLFNISYDWRTDSYEYTIDSRHPSDLESTTKETLGHIISLFDFDITELLFHDSERIRSIGKLLQEDDI